MLADASIRSTASEGQNRVPTNGCFMEMRFAANVPVLFEWKNQLRTLCTTPFALWQHGLKWAILVQGYLVSSPAVILASSRFTWANPVVVLDAFSGVAPPNAGCGLLSHFIAFFMLPKAENASLSSFSRRS